MVEPRLYSKMENKLWWRRLDDAAKHRLVNEAKRRMMALEFHMGGLSELDELFPDHFSFDLTMEIIGRPFRPRYVPEVREE